MRRRRAGAAVLCAVGLLVAAGCGGADDDASSTPGTPPAARAGAVASEGCSAGRDDELSSFQEAGTISIDGADRSFTLEVPEGASDDVPLPLVVNMHGATGSADIQEWTSGFGALGATEGFVVLSPNGPDTIWRFRPGDHDVSYLDQLIDRVEALGCIDTSRVYLTGFSMGGMMSVAMACQDPGRFAAIAPVAGMIDIDGCDDSVPVPLLTIHGTSDNAVMFDGTYGKVVSRLVPNPVSPPRPQLVAEWAARNGCTGQPTVDEIEPDVEHETFPCPPDASVEMYIVDDGSHAWPGSENIPIVDALPGHLTQTIDATEVIWRFFEAHQRVDG